MGSSRKGWCSACSEEDSVGVSFSELLGAAFIRSAYTYTALADFFALTMQTKLLLALAYTAAAFTAERQPVNYTELAESTVAFDHLEHKKLYLKSIDSNKDGLIQFQELLTDVTKANSEEGQMILHAFHIFDTDKDLVLRKDELKQLHLYFKSHDTGYE